MKIAADEHRSFIRRALCLAFLLAVLTFGASAEAAVPATVVLSGLNCGGPPGTVRSIGEGVIGTRVSTFIACFGPPIGERQRPDGRCLFYRDGEARRTYWEFCARKGRIVSASGNHDQPA